MGSLEDKAKAGRVGGRIGGLKKAASGYLDTIRTPESCAKGGRMAMHIRWHVNRGIVKSDCQCCEEDSNNFLL